jgi:hypothetical protein
VSWTGSDATSGVAGLDVLVATDAGPYVTWKQDVPAGTALYAGAAGHTYHFSAVAHDFAGNVTTLPPIPNTSTMVTAPKLAFATRPTITGKAVAGTTLSAGHTATSPSTKTYTYQWLRDGHAISGATKRAYVVAAADLGHHLSVRVRATKTGYSPVSATSLKTPAVVKATPVVKASASSPSKGTVVVKMSVTANAKPVANAKVTIKEGTRLLKTATVKTGSGSITLVGVAHGTHTYTVSFASTATVKAGSVKLPPLAVR